MLLQVLAVVRADTLVQHIMSEYTRMSAIAPVLTR